MKKEIEVKAKLKNRERVIEKLAAMGATLSKPIKQVDTVYTKVVGNVEKYLTNDHYLRIREKSDGRFIFTYKKPAIKGVLTKIEHESEIKDPQAFEQILLAMGYQVANKVIKHRQTAEVGEFEICIDDVEKMGSFIEVEKMSDADPEIIRKEVNDFLISLGVSLEDEVKKGYDIMAIEQGIY